jgi:putative flippase GtrA
VLVNAIGVHHIVAAVLSFCVAVTSNFILNRIWTFRARAGHAGFQAARFFTVSVCALGVNLIVLYGLVDLASAPTVASQAIAIAVAMPCNFVGNKLWTFAGTY